MIYLLNVFLFVGDSNSDCLAFGLLLQSVATSCLEFGFRLFYCVIFIRVKVGIEAGVRPLFFMFGLFNFLFDSDKFIDFFILVITDFTITLGLLCITKISSHMRI